MALHTSQGKDNPGPRDSLCLAALPSSSWPALPLLPSLLLPKARALSLSSPSHSEAVFPFSDPKSAPQHQGKPALPHLLVLPVTYSRKGVLT